MLIFNIKEGYNISLLLLFATLGNVLGSLLNYYLGLKGEEFLEKKRLLKSEKTAKYKNFFNKYGGFSLLFSWAPIIGDPITFIAGVLKYDFKRFLFLVTLAKFARYLFLALVVL
ncbi:YqaA family protein [Halarcobacter anaerophilus]|uniref:YqaA family protein n=1 Tax=Halarcobacter anaerophilus TaxID=877500 RepID=UPI000B23AB64|nr:VTT domain-containing protein [Halarcobacter anaerophilus]